MTQRSPSARMRADDRRSYWLLFWMTFCLFFAVACIARLLPRRVLVSNQGSQVRPSVFSEARSAASATIGYAFMG